MRITAQTDTHQVKSITLNPNTLKGGNCRYNNNASSMAAVAHLLRGD
jgi:hypothetical protein